MKDLARSFCNPMPVILADAVVNFCHTKPILIPIGSLETRSLRIVDDFGFARVHDEIISAAFPKNIAK